jgi:hypothetical protein
MQVGLPLLHAPCRRIASSRGDEHARGAIIDSEHASLAVGPRIPPSPLAGDDNAPLADAAGRAWSRWCQRLYTRKCAAYVRGRTCRACCLPMPGCPVPTHAAAPWTAGFDTIDRVQVQMKMKGKAPRVLPYIASCIYHAAPACGAQDSRSLRVPEGAKQPRVTAAGTSL